MHSYGKNRKLKKLEIRTFSSEFSNVFDLVKEVWIDTPFKTRLKIGQLEKVRFIKVNELKLTHVESFSFFFIPR